MAAQETFFNYGDSLSSKRLCQTFGILGGVGPITGFGSAEIIDSGSKKMLKIYPYASGDENSVSPKEEDVDPVRYIVRGRINSHRTTSEMGEEPLHSLIARDGTVLRVGQGTITIPIEGTDSREVFLFATHEHIPEKVDNPVTLRAIFNNSSYDFYSMYKKSRNPYYPSTDTQYLGSLSGNNDDRDPFLTSENSYSYLDDVVAKACTEYHDNRSSMVLVGVYGTGEDEINNRNEYFAIVPYQGQGISEIPYSYAIHNYLIRAINRIEKFTFTDLVLTNPDTGDKFNTLTEWLSWSISKHIKDFTTRLDNLDSKIDRSILKPGSIILWDQPTIPDGWEEYTLASGRVVIGYKSGGISIDQDSNIKILSNVGDVYDPEPSKGVYSVRIKGKDIPKHRHSMGLTLMGGEKDWQQSYPIPVHFQDRNTNINGSDSPSGYKSYHDTDGRYPPRASQGAVLSSFNLTTDDTTSESTVETLEISKLIPSITLRYIRKKAE